MTPEQEIKLLKELLYCTKRSCNNCGKVNCENFQRQRIDCCGLWVSYKDYITDLENKIADIKANCDLAIEGRDVKIMELEKENAELKETLKTYNGCGDWDNDFHTCRVYLQHEELQKYVEQLTKAKEIIKKFTEFVNNEIEYAPEHPQEHTDLWNGLCKQAEQFLKGENTILEDARAGNSPFDADEVFNKEMKAYPNRKVK